MYATVGTRPDRAFVVGKQSQFCHDPAVRHRKALDRTMRYLKGTADLALVYDHPTPNDSISYSGAAYGDDLIDRNTYSFFPLLSFSSFLSPHLPPPFFFYYGRHLMMKS